MDFKYCTKCNEEKPLDCFYKHKSTKDGLQYNCKACIKEYHAKYYLEHSEEIRAVQVKYFQTEAGKAAHARYNAKYDQTEAGKASDRKTSAKMRIKHPLEHKARNKVNNAVRDGRLIRPEKCSVLDCESTRVEAHHYLGYEVAHWVDVEWYCRKHHVEADRLELVARKNGAEIASQLSSSEELSGDIGAKI
jgi:hypothetical protein